MFDTLHGIVDGISGVVGEGGIDIGGGNVLLDPVPDMRQSFADAFAALVEIFSLLRTLLSI